MNALAGQVAVVTGAGRGFGRAIAERLAQEGAAVALLSRSLPQLDEVAQAIRAKGGNAIGVRCHVTDAVSIEHAIAKVGELGGKVLMGPMDIDAGRFAVVEDSAEAAFAIIKLAPGMD